MNHLLPKVIATITFTFLLSSLPAFASPPKPDSIKSAQIKEADGSSGQDTNSGSGIKTGHIQDGAITTEKIADHAVTDAKIAGPISASKISSNGLGADTVDGMHASDFAPAVHSHTIGEVSGLDAVLTSKADISHTHEIYQKKYANIVIVAKSGGDFTDPVSAITSITDATSENPYLVKIMPGVYDVGEIDLSLVSWIDVEGSGENSTVIAVDNVRGAINATLRNLTLVPATGSWIMVSNSRTSGDLFLQNVTVDGSILGVNDRLNLDGCSIKGNLEQWNAVTTPFVMKNSEISGRLTLESGDFLIYASHIDNIFLTQPFLGSTNLKIAHTQVDNGIQDYDPVGSIKCISVFDSNFNPIICP